MWDAIWIFFIEILVLWKTWEIDFENTIHVKSCSFGLYKNKDEFKIENFADLWRKESSN